MVGNGAEAEMESGSGAGSIGGKARRCSAAVGGGGRKNYGGGTPGTWAAFSGWADRWVIGGRERRGGVGPWVGPSGWGGEK